MISIAISILAILVLSGIFRAGGWLADIYFHRWYVFISTVLRKIFGKVSVSIGDVIYIVWVTVGMIFLLKIVWSLVSGRWGRMLYLLLSGIRALRWLTFIFLLFWGGNYQRTSQVADLGFDVKQYTTADLYLLTDTLVKLANRDRAAIDTQHIDTSVTHTFEQAAQGYEHVSIVWPALRYKAPSVKSSLFGKYMNYLGVTGYLNPFTNEAQVNTTVPAFLQPFTTCHEIAHQLGFAPEEDANFVGYLVAGRSADARFRYAANYEMLLYSIRQLARRNTYLARLLWDNTIPAVREDVRRMRLFYQQYEGPIDDYSAVLYDQYLKANRQAKGIHSYSEVVGWLMSYYRI